MSSGVAEMKDSDVMPFGKHKGEKLGDIPASYLLWAYDQEWCVINFPLLAAYVAKNYKALEQEANAERRYSKKD